jgi:hypothetical protein
MHRLLDIQTQLHKSRQELKVLREQAAGSAKGPADKKKD